MRSLGIIFNSSLFPNRAPKGYQNILTYIGGTLDPEIGNMAEDDIAAIVDKDIRKVLLRDDAKEGGYEKLGVKVWKTAIPQYYEGHADIMADLERDEEKVEGLFINGNWRSGVAFGDCVGMGLDDSAKIDAFLATKSSKLIELRVNICGSTCESTPCSFSAAWFWRSREGGS